MTINFPQRPKWLTFERLAMWLIVIVLAIWIFRSCGDKTTWQQKLADKEAQRKKEVDSVQDRFVEYQGYAFREISKWVDSSESLLAENVVLRYERDQAWVGLEKNKIAADKLIASIKGSDGKDSAACLELAEKYTYAAGQVVAYKNKSDLLIAKLDTAGSFKDKIINQQKKAIDNAIATNVYLNNQYNGLYESFGKLKPRNSVWFGVETTVMPGLILAGPQFAYQTKKGTQYQLSVGLDSKDVNYYVRAGLTWKISFRK